jgi:HD-GYP domain-containing protein (c-di-GMP phosphodiesterase class II)
LSWTDIPTWTLDVSNSIMEMVRMKDVETYFHCIRVSRGSRLLAKAAGLNEIEQRTAEFTGLFHDIGKVGIPDDILNKPGRLTESEMDIMKDHPELSVRILKPLAAVDFFHRLIPGVRHHHEWFDGRGYPHKIDGEKIPLAARLVLIADTFDAMTADRAYRKGRAPEVALKEISDFSGRQFDPQLVKIYLAAQPTWGAKDNDIFREMNHTVLKIAA